MAVALYHLIPLGLGRPHHRQPDQRVRAVGGGRRAGADGARARSRLERRGSTLAAARRGPRRRLPVAHQHARDPVRGDTRDRGAVPAGAAGRRCARRRAAIAVATLAAADPRGGRSTTRTSWTPIARSSRRIGHETATAASDAGGRTIARSAAARALLGAHLPRRRRCCCWRSSAPWSWRAGARRDRLTLALAGWTLSCAALHGHRHPDAGGHALLPRGGARRSRLPRATARRGPGTRRHARIAGRGAWPPRSCWRPRSLTGFHNWWSALG